MFTKPLFFSFFQITLPHSLLWLVVRDDHIIEIWPMEWESKWRVSLPGLALSNLPHNILAPEQPRNPSLSFILIKLGVSVWILYTTTALDNSYYSLPTYHKLDMLSAGHALSLLNSTRTLWGWIIAWTLFYKCRKPASHSYSEFLGSHSCFHHIGGGSCIRSQVILIKVHPLVLRDAVLPSTKEPLFYNLSSG